MNKQRLAKELLKKAKELLESDKVFVAQEFMSDRGIIGALKRIKTGQKIKVGFKRSSNDSMKIMDFKVTHNLQDYFKTYQDYLREQAEKYPEGDYLESLESAKPTSILLKGMKGADAQLKIVGNKVYLFQKFKSTKVLYLEI